MAASSRPDLIDPALLRSGRIDSHVYIGLPETSEERKDIMEKTLKVCNCKFIDGEESKVLAMIQEISVHDLSAKLTRADLKALITTAYLTAVTEHVKQTAIVCNTDTKEISNNVENNLYFSANQLWGAFIITRPSIQEDEMNFYESINSRFIK